MTLMSIIIQGSLVEVYYPSSHLAVVILFAMSSIGGALGFASLRPYSGLIGSSPGVYGLMGASAAMLCTYRSRIDPVVLFALPPTLVVHIVADIVLFLWSVGETAGDISHLFGTITGALAGLLFLQACTESSSKVPSIAWCAAIFLLLEMLSLIVIRAALWPPHANINPLDGRYDLRCCSGFLEWSQAAELHEDPDELGRCYKDIFYPYNSSSLS